LGIFAFAMGTAALPSLARQAAQNDMQALADTFGYTFRLVFFIILPAMVGLVVLREPIIVLLFKRGAFDHETTRLTASALLYYGIGLWAFAGVRILVATFYALEDTRTPVMAATVAIVANIALGLVLMRPMAHGGLALATSLASALNLILLVAALRRRLKNAAWGRIGLSIGKSLTCSLMMGGIVWLLGHYWLFRDLYQLNEIPLGMGLGAAIALGVGAFLLLARGLRMDESERIFPRKEVKPKVP
jgi:putative peptidoglycan lipid II flippase